VHARSAALKRDEACLYDRTNPNGATSGADAERNAWRDRKEVQQLIDLGKAKGFLTYEEVNDALPADVVAADQVEDVMSALGDEDIEIVDARRK